jgi:hypothetical protein
MRAKAKQGNGAAACTNYSLMNALSSNGGGDNYNCSRDSNSPTPKTTDATSVREEPQQVAAVKKENADVMPTTQAQDTITLLNRMASLSSQDSSKGSGSTARPSLRGHRQLSSRRPSNRRLQRGSLTGSSRRLLMLRSSINNGSIRSITESSFNSSASSLNDSSFNLSGSTSKFGESAAAAAGGGRRQHLMHDDLHGSINIMDFGISARALTAASSTALDESSRSLDESALEAFDGEEKVRDDGASYQRNKSRRELLVSWQHDDSSASLRLIQSFRTRNGECLDGSVRSEGDLDSFVDSCGFLDWPATREGTEEVEGGGNVGGGTITEESIIEEVEQQQEEETWNIEDYEGSGHSLDVAEHRLRHSTPSNPIAQTFKMFTRTRRASNASSTSSQEDSIDLSKIKESLLLAKGGKNNNKQSMEEVERGGGGSNKRGSMLPLGIFNKPPKDGRSDTGKTRSDDDNEMTTRRSSSQEEIWKRKSSRETAIWIRDSGRDFNVGDLKTMYTNKADTRCVKKRMSWNIFEGVGKNQSQPSSQRRSSTND